MPGAPVNPNHAPQQNANNMEVDDGAEEEESAMKWPGKRGNRKNKEI